MTDTTSLREIAAKWASAAQLEWSPTLCDGKRVTHAEAEKACAALGEGWRLPTRQELESILDLTRHEPAVDTARFPDTKSGWYWSRTPCAWSAGSAWIVGFYIGNTNSGRRGNNDAFVRAVRGVPQHGATEHGDERASKETLVPCDCGCGRSCCAGCGTDLGFIAPSPASRARPETQGEDADLLAKDSCLLVHGKPRFRTMQDGSTLDDYCEQLAVGMLTPVDQMALDNLLHDVLPADRAPCEATVLEVGFKYENGANVPTVLVGFAPEDWAARDRFAASLTHKEPAR